MNIHEGTNINTTATVEVTSVSNWETEDNEKVIRAGTILLVKQNGNFNRVYLDIFPKPKSITLIFNQLGLMKQSLM